MSHSLNSPVNSPVNSSISFGHDPVMAAEIVEVFAPVPHGVVVDATLGGSYGSFVERISVDACAWN